MRSLLTLLLLVCLSVTAGVAQQRSTTKKPGTAARKPATTTRKPATTRPAAVTQPAPVEVTSSQPASLTFPSTEPDTEPMDPVKKQQMYDELHGVKAKTAEPQGKGKGARESRRAKAEDTGRMPSESNRSMGEGSEASSFIGVKVGGNYAAMLSDYTISDGLGGTINLGKADPSYGFHAGIVAQFGNGGIAFQPEVLFNQNYDKDFVGNSVATSSLVVPLLAKFQFGQQGSTRFFVNVGPYGAYSLNNNNDGIIGYGGALGLGVGIPAGSGKFTVEARGYYGLGSTAEGSKFGTQPGNPILGQLSVGYLFPLGGR